MRYAFLVFIFFQLFTFLKVISEVNYKNIQKVNQIKWEKVDKKEIPIQSNQKIIWVDYKYQESSFQKILKNKNPKIFINNDIEHKYQVFRIGSIITEIDCICHNNFLIMAIFNTQLGGNLHLMEE